jgi:hypothetical protein
MPMPRFLLRKTVPAAIAISLFTSPAWGQPPSGQIYRLFGQIPVVMLAQLDEVAEALKLSEEQTAELANLEEELSTKRREAFMDAQGDFEAIRDDMDKLLAEIHKNSLKVLKTEQQKRAEEIFVQVNGPTALVSEVIAKRLDLNKEQIEKLAEVAIDNMYDAFDSMMEFQGMSEEERSEAVKKHIETRDEALLDVLTDEQKKKFETMGGEKFEVDLDKLPMPGAG